MTPTFRRIAGWAAVKAALLSVVFTVTFGLYVRKGYHWAQWTSSIALMLTAVVGVPVLVALYARVREAEPELAVIALVTGLLGVSWAIRVGIVRRALGRVLRTLDHGGSTQERDSCRRGPLRSRARSRLLPADRPLALARRRMTSLSALRVTCTHP